MQFVYSGKFVADGTVLQPKKNSDLQGIDFRGEPDGPLGAPRIREPIGHLIFPPGEPTVRGSYAEDNTHQETPFFSAGKRSILVNELRLFFVRSDRNFRTRAVE